MQRIRKAEGQRLTRKPLREKMANMRVYELARDLNLTNKILLEKLDEMDIAVKKSYEHSG